MYILAKYFFSIVNLIGANLLLAVKFFDLQYDSDIPIWFIARIFGWIPVILAEYLHDSISDVILTLLSIPIALILDLSKNVTYVNLFGTKDGVPKN